MDGPGGVKDYLTASFIGIIVAICGNVVISFALNCQKLAHKQLEEQRTRAFEQNGMDDAAVNECRGPEEGYPTATSSSESRPSSKDTQPLLFKPDGPSRSYTEPMTRSSPATLQYTIQPVSSPTTSPRRGRQTTSVISRGSRKTNGSTIFGHISEASTPEASEDNPQGSIGNGTTKLSRERSVSWIEENGPAPVKPVASSQSRFQSGNEETEYLKSKLWWIGLVLLNVGEFGNFLSYAFAPASVVAPLGSFALIANCFFAPFMLKERFRKQDLMGIAIAILGAVTVVSAAKSREVRLDPAGLLAAIKRIQFLIYAALNIIAASVLTFLSGRSAGQQWVVVDVGLCAVFGGFTVRSTKAISTLFTLRGLEIFEEPITYPIIGVLAATGVSQIKFLNRALMTFDSKVVIPTQFVLFTLAAIIGSAVLYRDFDDISFHRFVVFIYGCLTTFLGVYLLTREDEPANAEPDPESTVPLDESSSPETRRRSLVVNFTPLLTPRTIRIPEGAPTLRSRASRASLGLSPAYLLLASQGGSPDAFGAVPLTGALIPAQSNSSQRTRSQSRPPHVSGSLEDERFAGDSQ